LEAEGQFSQAHYAFDNGVLRVDLTRLIGRVPVGCGSCSDTSPKPPER